MRTTGLSSQGPHGAALATSLKERKNLKVCVFPWCRCMLLLQMTRQAWWFDGRMIYVGNVLWARWEMNAETELLNEETAERL